MTGFAAWIENPGRKIEGDMSIVAACTNRREKGFEQRGQNKSRQMVRQFIHIDS